MQSFSIAAQDRLHKKATYVRKLEGTVMGTVWDIQGFLSHGVGRRILAEMSAGMQIHENISLIYQRIIRYRYPFIVYSLFFARSVCRASNVLLLI